MLRHALIAVLAMGPAALPTASLAYDIKPKTPESAFAAKLRPDILGVSTDSSAESARAIFESAFRGRTNTSTDIQQPKFGGTAISYTAALVFSLPSGPKQTGEVLSGSFSSPASSNRAYFVSRNLTFAQDQQPSKAEMIKQVMDKYGAPTIVGNQHLYYIYRAGKIVSVGAKYKEATALEAVDRPLEPRTAIKLNDANGRGSCVAIVKRSLAKEKTLSAMLGEAKGANCDGALSVELTTGNTPDRVGNAQFTLLDFKRMISAAAIDGEALAAEQNERNPTPRASAPKL
ncbi:hypothetical protein KMZ29_16755 [Bradyrhizobium sediminis]|uniref:Uncharacterized protein n=2 Tax=Bradyrhizobium sediminis TaxID=2840469 RepID=A0A975RL76_9BRAD|nr:hypothetical protein KMZ29_16755 [Bradyrhizobium sediminis]